jgi:GT2 family glycosyltransferase
VISRSPLVSIVIVTYNSGEHVRRLLAALQADKPLNHRREIILVDNASSDDTAPRIREYSSFVHLLENERNVGFGAACNQGAQAARDRGSDYIAFLNPDTIPQPGWVEPLVAALEARSDLASVHPLIVYADDPRKISTKGNFIHFLGYSGPGGDAEMANDAMSGIRECAYSTGCACVFRSADFFMAGGFDERFFLYVEDQDLGWRLRLAGKNHAAVWDAVVRHHYEFDKSPEKFFFLERNRWVFMLAHFSWRTLLLIGPAGLAAELASWAYFILTGKARWKWKAEIDFLRPANLRWVFAKRRASQLTRRRTDRDLQDQLDGHIEFAGLRSRALHGVLNPLLSVYWKIARRLI